MNKYCPACGEPRSALRRAVRGLWIWVALVVLADIVPASAVLMLWYLKVALRRLKSHRRTSAS
jgi:hypothetical protein